MIELNNKFFAKILKGLNDLEGEVSKEIILDRVSPPDAHSLKGYLTNYYITGEQVTHATDFTYTLKISKKS